MIKHIIFKLFLETFLINYLLDIYFNFLVKNWKKILRSGEGSIFCICSILEKRGVTYFEL